MNIIHAIKNGKFSEIEDYITRGEDLNIQDEQGRTALMIAARSFSRTDLEPEVLERYQQIMFLLLCNGADVILPDHHGYTVFSYIISDNSEAFKMIRASAAADSFLYGVDQRTFDHKYDNLFVARLCHQLKSCDSDTILSFKNFLQRNNWELSEALFDEIDFYLITIEAERGMSLSGEMMEASESTSI